ncbi:MAG: hypothetical protein ACLQUY_08455 [Ktedonobacterales bacterium]
MFARVTSVSVQPDKVAEVVRIYNESILPAVKAATGKGMSITMWNTQADGETTDSSGFYREQVAKVSPFFSSPPSLDVYEVAVQG